VPRHHRGLRRSAVPENHPETALATLAEPVATQRPATLTTHLCVELISTTGVGGLVFKLVKIVLGGKKNKRELSCQCQITADE